MSKNNAGHQLTSDQLYRRQQRIGSCDALIAPTVVAVGIKTPANVGGIFRICEAVGCHKIIFVDVPHNNPNKIEKISRHTSDRVLHKFVSLNDFKEQVGALPLLVALEITSKSSNIYFSGLEGSMTLVVGSEKHGIPPEILNLCNRAVHIPMLGINSSMNVATALGIALYEWHRQFRE
jgi:23S rRNA (guanosine2251-2'-O)-methyltransferase